MHAAQDDGIQLIPHGLSIGVVRVVTSDSVEQSLFAVRQLHKGGLHMGTRPSHGGAIVFRMEGATFRNSTWHHPIDQCCKKCQGCTDWTFRCRHPSLSTKKSSCGDSKNDAMRDFLFTTKVSS